MTTILSLALAGILALILGFIAGVLAGYALAHPAESDSEPAP